MTDEVDALYGLDPDEFVGARDAIVRRLRKEGARDEAAAVARLRRPTVPAWALNVVARAHQDEVAAVLAAGERLRAAQDKALRGDATALRTATNERREAIAAVTALVADVLGDRAPAQAGAVSATLEAATVDPDVAELLRAGRLDRERAAAAAGFGFGDVGDWTPPPPRKTAPAKPAKPETAAKEPAARAERRAERPARKAAPERPARDASWRKELDAAVAESRARAKELHDAEQEVSRLKKELAEATGRVREARTRANRAELHAEQLRQRAWEEGERRR
ncbi:MAG TPA: hypothetical protein VGX28_07425 [Frankiaceae bacterium]|nr:hypothetical protein [Frankiaceae bacterium]